MNRTPEIEAFLAERRVALLSEDIEVMRAHLIKWGKPGAATAPADVLRIAWHKARTAVKDIPRAERERSLAWLREHGYQPLAGPDS